MKKNLLAIFEELAKVESMKADARAIREDAAERLYDLVDKSLSLKERIEAMKKCEAVANVWRDEVKRQDEKISFLNMYSIALKAEALKEAETIICKNLVDNFAKIDGVPARYKKVKAFIDCLGFEQIRAYYNEYYETIRIYIVGEGDRETHLYFTKKTNGEAVADLERCLKHCEHIARTPQEVYKNVEKFIEAKKELEQAAKEYSEKVASIKDGRACIGLDFDGRY